MIVLDRLRTDDMEAHLAGEDEEQARRFGWWPKRSGPDQFRAMLADDDLSWCKGGPRFRFAARAGDELVGGCEVFVRVPEPARVSYWTFPVFRERGYATRATRLLVDWALAHLGVDTVEVHVGEDNLPSLGAARAAGFEATGRRDDNGLLVLERRV